MLAKAGGDAREQKSLFIYPDSSVEHQLYLMHESQFRDRFQFPVNVREVPIYDLSDYIQLDRIMDEGDYVLAWDPLRTKLMTLDIFDEVPNTTFELPISLFSADSSRFSRNHIDALLRLFIAEMNFVGSNKLFAWSALLSDRPFRESLVRGAALNFDRDRTSTD